MTRSVNTGSADDRSILAHQHGGQGSSRLIPMEHRKQRRDIDEGAHRSDKSLRVFVVDGYADVQISGFVCTIVLDIRKVECAFAIGEDPLPESFVHWGIMNRPVGGGDWHTILIQYQQL